VIATVRTLMARVIDYAGLFPPARLPMSMAVAEYRDVQGESESWMLGRFVCPATRLAELAEAWPAQAGPPLAVVALGSGGSSVAELAERTQEDVAAIRTAHARPGRSAIVDQFEVRLPGDLLAAGDVDAVRETVAGLHGMLRHAAPVPMLLAVEAPVAGAPRESVQAVVDGIAGWNLTAVAAGHLPVCLKVRCGGLAAAAVPAVVELAGALTACRGAAVPIKATQGLHHPFRRFDHALGTQTHGFVNLLAAAILARAHDLDEAEVADILADREPSRDFTAEALTWGAYRASLTDIAAGRRHALLSFGSCSFAEPRDDLAAFGLLEE